MPDKMYPLTFTWAQRKAARKYVDDTLAVMAKYGSKPMLSRARYRKLIADVLEAIPKHLRKARDKK